MRKTHKKLTLKSQTVRSLHDPSLTAAAGGWTIWTEATSCTPTVLPGCHVNTPNCPR